MDNAITPFRLVYNTASKAVLSLGSARGVLTSPASHAQFTGTPVECQAEIARLHLTPLPDPALTAAKQAKLGALSARLAQPLTASGLTLAADEGTMTQMNHLVTLLSLYRDRLPTDADRAQLLAANVSAVTGPILDAAGAAHDMTVDQVFALVLAYGQAYGAARAVYLTAAGAVNAATTIAAVQAVP